MKVELRRNRFLIMFRNVNLISNKDLNEGLFLQPYLNTFSN